MELMTRHPEQRSEEPVTPGGRPSRVPPGLVVAMLFVVVGALAVFVYLGKSPAPAVKDSAPTTVAAPVATPPPVAASPDFTTVVRMIVATANDLRIHPDPSRLSTYMEPTNPSYADALSGQSQLASGALRYDPPPGLPVVGSVRVVSADPDSATLDVTFTSTPHYRVVDRVGNVVSDSTAGVTTARWVLHRSGDTWRLASAGAL